jgi:hypothetical protein
MDNKNLHKIIADLLKAHPPFLYYPLLHRKPFAVCYLNHPLSSSFFRTILIVSAFARQFRLSYFHAMFSTTSSPPPPPPPQCFFLPFSANIDFCLNLTLIN